MFNLVEKCIDCVDPEMLKMYVKSCFRKMREYLHALPYNVNYPDKPP